MGTTPSVERRTPLAEVLENWSNIPLSHTLKKKKLILLCQEEWPFLTRTRGGEFVDVQPPKGISKIHKLKFLWIILEDAGTQDTDYWYIWYNWAQQRRKPAGNHNNGGRLSPSAPFAPSAPQADDDNSTSKGTGMYPMKLDYIPNPRTGSGAPSRGPCNPSRGETWTLETRRFSSLASQNAKTTRWCRKMCSIIIWHHNWLFS